jgi:hypothetical protein
MTPVDRWPDADPDERLFVREFDQSIAALEQRTRACPPMRLLLAADAGVLPEAVAAEIASHRQACTSCDAMARDARAAELGEPADADVRQLRSLVGAGAAAAASHSRRWNRMQAWAVAASFVAVVIMGAWVARVATENAELRSAQVRTGTETPDAVAFNVPLIDLEPVDALRGAAVAQLRVPASARLVVLVLATNAHGGGPAYAAEIRDGSGRLAWSGAGLTASDMGTVTLVVPSALIPRGTVTVRLLTGAPPAAALAHEYALAIEDVP